MKFLILLLCAAFITACETTTEYVLVPATGRTTAEINPNAPVFGVPFDEITNPTDSQRTLMLKNANAVVAFRSWTQMTILKPVQEGVMQIPNLNKENVRQLLDENNLFDVIVVLIQDSNMPEQQKIEVRDFFIGIGFEKVEIIPVKGETFSAATDVNA